jgi:putative ABC transport system permease protein
VPSAILGVHPMSGAWHELKIAVRSLVRERGFSGAAILTLAVAVALQTAVVAVVNAYVVRALPYPESDRLYNVIYAQRPASPPEGLSSLNWTSLSDLVEHPIAWDLDVFYMLGSDYPETVPGAWVTRGFVQGLGIHATLGRSFTSQDFEVGAPQVALISHELWRGRFGGDSSILGRAIRAYVSDRPTDPQTFTIVGVLPANFWHVNPYTQVLTPLRAPTYPYMVRLRPGVQSSLVERRIETLAKDARLPVTAGWRVELRPTHAEYVSAAKPMLLAIGGAVTLVLLIGCANVALLMILRGMRRRKEFAVRLALGASMARLVRLQLTESLVLVTTATTFGIVLAILALRAVGPMIESQLGRRVPGGVSTIAVDWTVLGAMCAGVMVVAIVLSLAPLLGVGAAFSALRERRGSGLPRGRRIRSALIAVEVAGSLALLSGCGLMVRSVVRLLDVELGVRTEQVIGAAIAVREQTYPDARTRQLLFERLIAELSRTGVAAPVALSMPSPLASFDPRPVRTANSPGSASASSASIRAVAGSYFELLGIPIVRGRSFAESDRGGGEPVAIVSETAARRLWPGENPIGRSVRLVENQISNLDTMAVARTIVGVARDVRQSPTDEQVADVYVPLLQTAGRFASVVVRTSAALPSWLALLRETVRKVDAEIAVGSVESLDATVQQQLARPRFLVWLFAAFGGFSATLGVMGLYAVIAYAVKQREHEIAIRMAVGADARRIVRMFLHEGSRIVLRGIALGLLGAVGAGRLLQAQLFGVRPTDAVTLAAVSLLLIAASIAAIWWPSRRASRADPVIALKAE